MTTPIGPYAIADAFSVRDQVVIVTGAVGRIGSAIVEAFALNGARVIATDREPEALDTLAQHHRAANGIEIVPHAADLRSSEDLRRVVASAGERFGRLDGIVHSGAIIASSPMRTESIDHFELLFETNVRSLFLLVKYALPQLENSGGAVTTISSVNGHRPLFPCPLYAGTKAAVTNMSRSLAAEFGENRIRFNTVSPGSISEAGGHLRRIANRLHPPHAEAFVAAFDADFTKVGQSEQPLPTHGTGYDVAMACLYLASPAARFVTGADLLVDGGKLHMFEQQLRTHRGKELWPRVRQYLLALPDDAWAATKPEWLTRT